MLGDFRRAELDWEVTWRGWLDVDCIVHGDLSFDRLAMAFDESQVEPAADHDQRNRATVRRADPSGTF